MAPSGLMSFEDQVELLHLADRALAYGVVMASHRMVVPSSPSSVLLTKTLVSEAIIETVG